MIHIIRDKFCKGVFYAYVPAAGTQNRWTIYQIGYPICKDDYRPNVSLHAIYYGRVCEGKTFPAFGGAWGTESGSWIDNDDAANGTEADFVLRRCYAQNSYVDVAIPANHNVIHLYCYDIVGSASLSFAWDDGSTTGLDVTSYVSFESKLKTIVLATTAVPDGIKKLRIKQTTAGAFRIFGLQSWNSSVDGNPATTVDGLAVGHTPIMQMSAFADNSTSLCWEPASDSIFKRITTGNVSVAYLWGLLWRESGGTLQPSGEGTHFIPTGNHPFTLDAGYATDGFNLIVDSTDCGGIYNLTNQPLAKVYSGKTICIRGTGYLNEGSLSPDIDWSIIIDDEGIRNNIQIIWDGNIELTANPAVYPIMFYPNSSLLVDGSWVSQLPNGTKINIYGLTDYTSVDASSELFIYLNGQEFGVTLRNNTLPADWLITHPAGTPPNKIYAKCNVLGQKGDITPASGDRWILSGGISVKKLLPSCSLVGY